jgi:hypothetical protein
MAAGVVSRLTKRGIRVKSIQVGAEHRRRPKPKQHRIVVAEVMHSPCLSEFESETFAIHSTEDLPKLHNPSVFSESCLATYDFACKAGFKNSAHLLISVPIPCLAKLKAENFEKLGMPHSTGLALQERLEIYKRVCKLGFREWAHLLIGQSAFRELKQADFEKLGVPHAVGLEIQLKLEDPNITPKKRVTPIGVSVQTPLMTTIRYDTTKELLRSNDFVEYAHCLQTVPIDRLAQFESRDFKELQVPYLYGRCVQNIMRRAQNPQPFMLF